MSDQTIACLEELERSMVHVVTRTIPASRLHSFDVMLDKVLIEYNVIEQTHYTPRTGAERQTVLLRGAHTPDAAGRTVYWTGRMAKGYFDNSMQVERRYSLFGRVVLSFMGVDAQCELGYIKPDFNVNGGTQSLHTYTLMTRFPTDAEPLLQVAFHNEGWVQEISLDVNFSQMPRIKAEVDRMLRNAAVGAFLEHSATMRMSVILDSVSMKERRKALAGADVPRDIGTGQRHENH